MKSTLAFVLFSISSVMLYAQHINTNNSWYHDTDSYEKGLELADASGKPILLEFTGHIVVNGRKMEHKVLEDASVKSLIDSSFVYVRLYVDERIELPDEEKQTVSLDNGRKINLKTYGDKWSYLQMNNYGMITQPYYAIIDEQENIILKDGSFIEHGTVELFNNWLEKGLSLSQD